MGSELLVFLPVIVAIGAITSYDDIKYGKIRNKYIIAALVYTVIAYASIVLYLGITDMQINYTYLIDLALNGIIALAFGFVTWNFGLWSAADAKLFSAYSVLLPLTVYSNTYITYFPSFVLLINTFVPAFIYISYKILKGTNKKEKTKFLKKLNFKELPIQILNLLWIIWVIRLVLALLNVKPDLLIMLFISFGFVLAFQKIIGKERLKFTVAFLLLRVLFDPNVTNIIFAYEVIFVSVFMLLAFVVMNFARYSSSKKLSGIDMKEPLPFAPFLFFGVLLTIISSGMFTNVFMYFF